MTTHALDTRSAPLSSLRPHPRNARNGDVEAIAQSLTTNGQYRPIVVANDGTILAGNHTYAAALSLGWEFLSVVDLDIGPESEEALRIMVADNRTADLGNYDTGLLLELLGDLPSLVGTGYEDSDLAVLQDLADTPLDLSDQEDDDKVPNDVEGLLDILWGEPEHKVHHGDRYTVGPHVLIVARPDKEWEQFVSDLGDGDLLCLYPDPYLPLGKKAEEHRLVLVQPNAYLAGHLLDKYVHAFGPDSVKPA